MRLTRLTFVTVLTLGAFLAPESVIGQGEFAANGEAKVGDLLEAARQRFGWEWFEDRNWKELLPLVAIVGGALVCGILLSYHPSHRGRQAGLEEMDQPKIIITYTMVGALVGIVVSAVPEMAFAIFGIGGLMRFRTELSAPRETGRVILATVIGIFCGLEFWVVVIFATVIAWLLILVLDVRVGYRMMVRGLEPGAVGEAAQAYRTILEGRDIVVTQEKRNVNKKQVSFVFKAGRDFDKEKLEEACRSTVAENLRGIVDWPEEG